MESPLDVLSRAASMVETNEISNSVYKRSSPVEHGESTDHDFPSKYLKHDRIPERHTYSSHHHIITTEHNKKTITAGTQTQFSSLSTGKPPAYSFYTGHDGSLPPPTTLLPPPPPPLTLPPPPPPPPITDMEQNTPLNLSLNTSKDSSSLQQHRPSVITCVTSSNQQRKNVNSPNSPVQHAIVTDFSIEEHFRRSLGRSYSADSPPKDSPEPIIEPKVPDETAADTDVSITGSVDDHFAKSLGDTTWTAIKAKNDLVALDLFSGSVDDHFAKALGGDTWLRIKAEKESNCSSSASNSPQQVSLMTN